MSEELAWAAGFFDGEGSTCISRTTKGGHKYQKPHIEVAQSDRAVLDRMRAILGIGKVYGPYVPKTNRLSKRPYYRLTITSEVNVQAAIRKMWPWLSEQKRQQAERVFAEMAIYRARPKLKKGFNSPAVDWVAP